MNRDQKEAIRLNKKMKKSYFGNFLRNVYRKSCNSLSRKLITFANLITKKERNFKTVLKNYDKIAGGYVKAYDDAQKKDIEHFYLHNGKPCFAKDADYYAWKSKYLAENVFNLGDANSILEVGAGECTTLAPALKQLNKKMNLVAALDLSWSRMAHAKKFCDSIDVKVDHFVTGNAYFLPFADNSFDIVYTYHCLEQMPLRKKQSLHELYRITRKYLVLIEPSYELGNVSQKLRLRNRNYIRKLPQTLKKMNYNLIKHELMEYGHYGNASAIHIVEKNTTEPEVENIFVCPESKKPLSLVNGHYFCKENNVVYPVLGDIALLDQENAIIASKFTDI